MQFDHSFDIIIPQQSTNLAIGGSGALVLPTGTTAQRPGSPTAGMIRYNQDNLKVETYESGGWLPLATPIQRAVRVASAPGVPINLSAPGTTIDGVTMSAGDRVLVWQQASAAANGIYVWNGAAVPMTRAPDQTSDWSSTVPGRLVYVLEGNSYANFQFQSNAPTTGTFDVTQMIWASDAYFIGEMLLGDSATPARATSSVITQQRVFTLIDTVAFQRIWRYTPTGSNLNCGIELVVGDNDSFDSPTNHWWDISARGEFEGIQIVRRTGAVYEPKLFINQTGGLTIGSGGALTGGSIGTDYATQNGVDLYVNGTSALRVSTGTTAQRPASPTDGMFRYNTDHHAFEGYSSPYGITPLSLAVQRTITSDHRVWLVDDFVNTPVPITTARVGNLGWVVVGAGTHSVITAEDNHPGIIQLSTNTTVNNIARIQLGAAQTTGVITADQVAYFCWIIRIPSIVAVAVRFGIGQDLASNTFGTNSVMFYFSPATAPTSPNWQFATRAASVTTNRPSTIAVAANTWYMLEAFYDGTTWTPYINGNSAGMTPISTTMPSTSVNVGSFLSNTTGTSKTLQIDYFSLISRELSPRY